MDFDNIKKTWKNSFNKNEVLDKSRIEAQLKIKSKSNTALNKVKRNYKFDLYAGLILTILIVYHVIKTMNFEYKYIFVSFIVLFFGSIIWWSIYNFLKIRKTEISSDKLKPALKQTIKDIERFVNFNKSTFAKYLLMPLSICTGMLYSVFQDAGNIAISEILSKQELIKLVIFLVVFSALFIPLAQYYNKKMFKRHLDELKKCLDEFDDIDDIKI
jgi:arsenate reductase-like glutaredoxin family protein